MPPPMRAPRRQWASAAEPRVANGSSICSPLGALGRRYRFGSSVPCLTAGGEPWCCSGSSKLTTPVFAGLGGAGTSMMTVVRLCGSSVFSTVWPATVIVYVPAFAQIVAGVVNVSPGRASVVAGRPAGIEVIVSGESRVASSAWTT